MVTEWQALGGLSSLEGVGQQVLGESAVKVGSEDRAAAQLQNCSLRILGSSGPTLVMLRVSSIDSMEYSSPL